VGGAVFDLRALPLAVVAQGEGVRSGEVMTTQDTGRARFGRELDELTVNIILEVIELVLEFLIVV